MNRIKIPTLFVRDAETKLVKPEIISDDYLWAKNDINSLVTIKIDGISVRVDLLHGKWTMFKKIDGDWTLESQRNDPHDAPLWRAFDALASKVAGLYEVYGPGIRSNAQNAADNFMIRTRPVDFTLIVQNHKHRIMRGAGVTVQEFYDSIKQELTDSPEIEGIVFHEEGKGMVFLAGTKVKRTDFGLPWPLPFAHINPEKADINSSSTNLLTMVH